jgi:hypothetical protein
VDPDSVAIAWSNYSSRECHVSVEQTQKILDRYFDAMGRDEDFSAFFADDVTWIMVESEQEVRGPTVVRDYLIELHGRMVGGEQRSLVVSDGHAYLEGDTMSAPGPAGQRLFYCLVYDLGDDRITAMRCYGSLGALMTSPRGEQPQ